MRSDHSLLQSTIRPEQIAEACAKYEYGSCVLSDNDTLSGSVDFIKACKDKKIKPILSKDFILKDGSSLQLIAKNLDGWKMLLKITAYQAKQDIDIRGIASLVGTSKNLICINNGLGSYLSTKIFSDNWLQMFNANDEMCKELICPDFMKNTEVAVQELVEIFGKENVFLGTSHDNISANSTINSIYRSLPYNKVYCNETSYLEKLDAADQRILLCVMFRTNLQNALKVISSKDPRFSKYFRCNDYWLPNVSGDDIISDTWDGKELDNTQLISDMCEEYSILGKLTLPKFDCPNNMEEKEYIRELCINGWKKFILPKIPKEKLGEYGERVKSELEVINGAGLAGYFLIVQDYLNFARTKGLVGPGRGSSSGSLVAMLTGITMVDPIEYNLLFERFYNAGRNTKDRIALPDIDCDFPINRREDIFNYIREKYGHNKVSQISTYSRMQGRSIITEVINAHNSCTFDEIKRITEHIPDESKISDDLQEMEEEDGGASILKWALENKAEELSEWVSLKDGKIESENGNFGNLFEQAIRLEGLKKSRGKHAAGIVISPIPIEEMVPIIKDKSGELIAALEMNALEAMGLAKMDILGLGTLDRLEGVQRIISTGEL
jgi:DNA polymerase-3 subunit alpha